MFVLVDIKPNEEDDGGLSIVHSQWMTPLKRHVYWPPCVDKLTFNKVLFGGETATSKWKIYDIGKVLYETGMFL